MDFEKIQISISIANSSLLETINMINIEIGYKSSYGEIIWKSLARIKENNDFKKVNYNGNFQDVLEQATWKNFDENKTFVFDFSSSESDEIYVKQTISKKSDNSIETKEIKIKKRVNEYKADFFTLKITNIEI
ncbi:hypothetical protein [Flavobacterium sp.]|jgi:hypothetical protein|uniref:hypothetical protein n=1 Tax=Flavobacterium sp. TaxID=239 RepID=UPI0038FC6CFB